MDFYFSDLFFLSSRSPSLALRLCFFPEEVAGVGPEDARRLSTAEKPSQYLHGFARAAGMKFA